MGESLNIIFDLSGLAFDVGGYDVEKSEIYIDALTYSMGKYAEENGMLVIHVGLTNKNYTVKRFTPKLRRSYFIYVPKNKPWKAFGMFSKFVRNTRILQINSFPKPWIELPCLILAKLFRVKVVDFMHNVYEFKKLAVVGRILNVYHRYFYLPLVNLILVYTRYQKRIVSKYAKKPIIVFHSGVDPNIFKSNPKSKAKGSDDKLTLLYVGLVTPLKKVEEIVEAICDNSIRDKVRLWIVGPILDFKYFNELREKLNEHRIEHKFFGPMPNSELPQIYSKADLFVNMRPDEAFGKVFVESMACGTPVIGRKRSPGPEELIINGWNGFLVRDCKELTSLLVSLLGSRKKLEELSMKCVRFVSDNYTFNKSYWSLRNAYNVVLGFEKDG